MRRKKKIPLLRTNIGPLSLQTRLENIQTRILKAAIASNRNPKNITLVAVTKTFPINLWKQAISLGLTTLAENRVQEAIKKIDVFLEKDKIKLHFVGHLQTNKIKKAIEIFDVIQTVDSLKLAENLNSACKKASKKQDIFIQLNISADSNKYGLLEKDIMSITRKISTMDNLILKGIMTIPAADLSQKTLISIYKKTRKTRDLICANINSGCTSISMGMSRDYEIAIAEGSTHIRIGTALFGTRKK